MPIICFLSRNICKNARSRITRIPTHAGRSAGPKSAASETTGLGRCAPGAVTSASVWRARVCSTHVCMGNDLSFPYAGVSNYHPRLSAAASFLGEPSAPRQEGIGSHARATRRKVIIETARSSCDRLIPHTLPRLLLLHPLSSGMQICSPDDLGNRLVSGTDYFSSLNSIS